MKYLSIFLLLPIYLIATTKVVIIGDSITLGKFSESCFVDILQQRFIDEEKDIILINRSCEEATTDVLEQLAIQTIKQDTPDYVVVCLGIYDAMLDIPIKKTRRNFIDGVGELAYSTRVLIGVNTTYTVNSNPIYVFGMSDIYQKLDHEYSLYFFNFLSKNVLDTASNQIFPNAIGHQMIADNLYQALQEAGL